MNLYMCFLYYKFTIYNNLYNKINPIKCLETLISRLFMIPVVLYLLLEIRIIIEIIELQESISNMID